MGETPGGDRPIHDRPERKTVGLLDQFRLILGKNRDAMPAPEASVQSGERRTRPRINPREGTRILVIDDSATVLVALKRILRSAGCVTFTAESAEIGLEIAQRERPHLIFLDIVLPGMNGFAALRALRRDPLGKDIPVIMMSGNEQATAQFFGARIGADDFLHKPFTRYDVFSRIERLLDENQDPFRPSLQAETSGPNL